MEQINSEDFLMSQAAIKFEIGANEHCQCQEDICICWDHVDYKKEAMEECYDLVNYLSRGLINYNPEDKIDYILGKVVELFDLIIPLDGPEKNNGHRAL